MTGMMWNEAAKHAAERQVMQPPCPAKVVEPNTTSLTGAFKQHTLPNQLANVEVQCKVFTLYQGSHKSQ